jgi:hypothetical protein
MPDCDICKNILEVNHLYKCVDCTCQTCFACIVRMMQTEMSKKDKNKGKIDCPQCRRELCVVYDNEPLKISCSQTKTYQCPLFNQTYDYSAKYIPYEGPYYTIAVNQGCDSNQLYDFIKAHDNQGTPRLSTLTLNTVGAVHYPSETVQSGVPLIYITVSMGSVDVEYDCQLLHFSSRSYDSPHYDIYTNCTVGFKFYFDNLTRKITKFKPYNHIDKKNYCRECKRQVTNQSRHNQNRDHIKALLKLNASAVVAMIPVTPEPPEPPEPPVIN